MRKMLHPCAKRAIELKHENAEMKEKLKVLEIKNKKHRQESDMSRQKLAVMMCDPNVDTPDVIFDF